MANKKGYKEFERRWLGALLAHRPRNMSQDDFLSYVMSVDSRFITLYRVKRNLNLPGLIIDDEQLTRPRLLMDSEQKRSSIKKSDIISVRVDDRTPEEIIIETKSSLLQLTRKEWDDIRHEFTRLSGEEL